MQIAVLGELSKVNRLMITANSYSIHQVELIVMWEIEKSLSQGEFF